MCCFKLTISINESKGQADASMVLNTCETVAMGDGGGPGARSDAGGVRHDRAGPDGHANQSDTSSGHRNVLNTCNGTNTIADAMESISTRRNVPQMQDLPVEVQRRDKVESRSRADMPNMHIDTHGIVYHANMAGNRQRHISTWPADPKPQDLPTGCTRPCRDAMDGLESHAGTQARRRHAYTSRTLGTSQINLQTCQ